MINKTKAMLFTIIMALCTHVGLTFAQVEQSNNAVILLYHHVAEDTPSITSVLPSDFSQQLDYLVSNHFNIWPLPKLVSSMYKGESIPAKTVAITFDDAYESIYTEAYPRLKALQLPFTIFVTTDSVDKQFNQQLSWDKIQEMSLHGASIANHTLNHPHMLKHLEHEDGLQWQQRIKNEINQAQLRIKEKIGSQHKLFAYPYGEYNQNLATIVKELGYLGFGQQSGAFSTFSNAQYIPRFPVAGNYSQLDDFIVKVNTKALPADDISMADNPILAIESRPLLSLSFHSEIEPRQFNCYGPGGKLAIDWQGNIANIRAQVDIPAGRSRYNCTLPTGDGHYYWFSKAWVRLNNKGEWLMY